MGPKQVAGLSCQKGPTREEQRKCLCVSVVCVLAVYFVSSIVLCELADGDTFAFVCCGQNSCENNCVKLLM